MKIMILTQEDAFVIPKNILLLAEKCENVEICEVVNIQSDGALVNKALLFLSGFGVLQMGKLLLKSAYNKVHDLVGRVCNYRIAGSRSLRGAARRCRASYRQVVDVNSVEFIKSVKSLQVDLIISYSAPVVFCRELLAAPKIGCINLHCSLLPKYAGLLPSFWALYFRESEIGATIHCMDNKIDNGDVIAQRRVKMPQRPSMYSVIALTKSIGGELMVDVVNNLAEGQPLASLDKPKPDKHFTWPTISEIREFRKSGGRLV